MFCLNNDRDMFLSLFNTFLRLSLLICAEPALYIMKTLGLFTFSFLFYFEEGTNYKQLIFESFSHISFLYMRQPLSLILTELGLLFRVLWRLHQSANIITIIWFMKNSLCFSNYVKFSNSILTSILIRQVKHFRLHVILFLTLTSMYLYIHDGFHDHFRASIQQLIIIFASSITFIISRNIACTSLDTYSLNSAEYEVNIVAGQLWQMCDLCTSYGCIFLGC